MNWPEDKQNGLLALFFTFINHPIFAANGIKLTAIRCPSLTNPTRSGYIMLLQHLFYV